jgi:hypothetical protein
MGKAMAGEHWDFYSAVLTAGSVLTGFCGTFLQFRIQREANYYRQPVVSYDLVSNEALGTDAYIGLSHFTFAFLLSILATLFALCFGFVFPLIALVKRADFVTPELIMWGLFGSLILLIASFGAELIHYEILPGFVRDYLREHFYSQDPQGGATKGNRKRTAPDRYRLRSRLHEVTASDISTDAPIRIAFVDTGNSGRRRHR